MSFRRYVLMLCVVFIAVSGGVVAQSTRHQLLQTFTSSTPAAAKQFGEALVIGDALDGWPLFVGSPNMPGLGRVERFINTGASWEATNCVLTQVGTQKGTGFGEALATSGVGANALLLVGEPYFNKSGGFADNGRVSVFRRDAGTNCLSRIAMINPPVDAANQLFGASIDISVGATVAYAIIGAPTRDELGVGAAYIYRSTNGGKTWALDASYSGGTAGTAFGYDVAIDGANNVPTAVVGAMNETTDTLAHGGVHVYRRENDTWSLDEELIPDSGFGSLNFGWSVDVAVSSTRTFVIGSSACKTCDTSNAVPRVWVYERMEAGRAVTYQDDAMISSRFAIGEDLVLKNQPGSADDFFMAFTSTAYYYELWKRVDRYYWQASTTQITGSAGNRIAVAASAGFEPHLAVGQADLNTAWISAPSASSFELLGNGDFGEGAGSNSGVPRKWKSSNRTEDGRKCGKTTGCYYNFKGSAGENSLLKQAVKLTNHQFNVGDVLSLTADLKTSAAAPNLLITLAVTEDGNTIKGSLLLDSPTLDFDWQTIAPITHTLCDTPSKIVVSFRNKTKNGTIRVDNVSLMLSAPPDTRACRLALPPAP